MSTSSKVTYFFSALATLAGLTIAILSLDIVNDKIFEPKIVVDNFGPFGLPAYWFRGYKRG